MEFKLDGVLTFRLNQFTGRYVLHILARLTSYMEDKAGVTKYFEDYVSRSIKNPYDIEHVWAIILNATRVSSKQTRNLNYLETRSAAWSCCHAISIGACKIRLTKKNYRITKRIC